MLSLFVLKVAPLACRFLEGTRLEGSAIALSAPLWRWHGVAVDILAGMSLLSAAALKVRVSDLRLAVGLQQVLKLSHTTSDGHVWYLIGLLEAIEELKFGVILFALEFGEI